MIRRKIYCGAAFGFALAGFANAQAPIPANIEAHVRAAREAAKFEWVGTLSRDYVAPELGSPEIGGRGVIPDRSLWFARPAKVFDNLYFLGTRFHSSWALTTSDGIILVDTLYNYAVQPEIVDGLKTLGLDPATIKICAHHSRAWRSRRGGDAPPDKESYVVKIDPSNGVPLAKYPVRSHELSIAPDGTLLPATRSSQLLLLEPLAKVPSG